MLRKLSVLVILISYWREIFIHFKSVTEIRLIHDFKKFMENGI